LLTAKEVTIILHRLVYINRKHLIFQILVGIQPRGVLAERLKEILQDEYQTPEIQLGYISISIF
jgi:pyrimidine operon attenuation protein/uracil phosphoribosyltransferase